MKRAPLAIALIAVGMLLVILYTQVTLFVIQPIGALPEGVTLVITRGQKLNFVDSADALCQREMGGVNLLCRAAVIGAVSKNANILVRLPYSQTLYEISTGGKIYDK